MINLNATDLGPIQHISKSYANLAAAVRWHVEFFDHGLISSPGAGENIKVGEHRGPVDGNIELPAPNHKIRGINLRKMESHKIRIAGIQIGERVAKGSIPFGLINSLGSGIGHAADINGGFNRSARSAAGKV